MRAAQEEINEKSWGFSATLHGDSSPNHIQQLFAQVGFQQ